MTATALAVMKRPKKHLSFGSLVHGFRKHLATLLDKRKEPDYSLVDIIMSGFACMFFQDRSLLQFQKRMKDKKGRNNLETLFDVKEVPKESQLRDVIDEVDSENFRPLFKDYFSRLQRGKHLEQFSFITINGKTYCLVSIDGTGYFSSKKISCDHCLHKEHKEGEKTYQHQALQGALMHPNMRQVIPFMPEDIRNSDGQTKQDCEMNAAKRFLIALRQDHPQLGIIIVGDGLFSKHPLVELAKKLDMHVILVAKPKDHKYMMKDIASREEEVQELRIEDDKDRLFIYRWLCNVPLGARDDAFSVNYFELEILAPGKDGEMKRNYYCSWVTDLPLSEENIEHMVRAEQEITWYSGAHLRATFDRTKQAKNPHLPQ